MCKKCKNGEICIDGLLDGSQSVGGVTVNVGPAHGVPPLRVGRARNDMISYLHSSIAPFDCNALGLVESAEALLRLTGLPGGDVAGYESYLKMAVNDLRSLWQSHVASKSACYELRVEKNDGAVVIDCRGCGEILRRVEIG